MYFIFSKLLLFLIDPFYWVMALFIIALFCKKPKVKKRLFVSSAIVFFVFSTPLFLNQFIKCWNYPHADLKATDTYSCAILLGGFASEDSHTNGYFNTACDRFIQALKLKTTGKVSHILVSSGNSSLRPDKFREGDWVKTQLLQLNIPDSSILIEDNSRNTFENAAFSKKVLQSKHLQPPYILVTGAFHMRRAMLIFKKAGIAVIPYPAEKNDGNVGFSIQQLIPQPETLATWPTYLKEIVGLIITYLK